MPPSADSKKKCLLGIHLVQGRWIHVQNVTEISQQYSTSNYSRVVTNITMAMPHVGIFAATLDPINSIVQPQALDVGLSR